MATDASGAPAQNQFSVDSLLASPDVIASCKVPEPAPGATSDLFVFFLKSPGLWLTYGAAVVFGCALVVLACRIVSKEPSPARELNLLALLLGSIAGWALSLFWIPLTDAEKSTFTQIGTAVSAFVGGFVLSKLEPMVASWYMRDGKADYQYLPRTGLFVGALALTALAITAHRVVYLSSEMETDSGRKKLLKLKSDYSEAHTAFVAAASRLMKACNQANPK